MHDRTPLSTPPADPRGRIAFPRATPLALALLSLAVPARAGPSSGPQGLPGLPGDPGSRTAPAGSAAEAAPTDVLDLVVHAGEVLRFDTTTGTASGTPLAPRVTAHAIGGLLVVRDVRLEAGGVMRVLGDEPFELWALGTVEIRGRLDASGFDALDVATLNTANLPEIGAAGGPGGGAGGDASGVTNDSTPSGSPGTGALGATAAGGAGGETGYSPGAAEQRRPGGGGGGRFAADSAYLLQLGPDAGLRLVFAALGGGDGAITTTGALTGLSPAQGGTAGPGPFQDGTTLNDVLGLRPVVDYGDPDAPVLLRIVRGELAALSAGTGGGGGGDASSANVFPTPSWTPASDEKGGAGGGGGGALRIVARGPIVFGAAGEIRADGGRGAAGENTSFLDHIGGSGGGGSGGHVVLESASYIDFTDGGANDLVTGHVFVQALGGAGGPGAPGNPAISRGGAGGAGVIQLHVRHAVRAPSAFDAPSPADIRVPSAAAGDPRLLGELTRPPAIPMFLLELLGGSPGLWTGLR